MVQEKVSDMTIDEFKLLIQATIKQTLGEFLSDPDEGLELREEIQARLRKSLDEPQTASAQDVAAKLGLEW